MGQYISSLVGSDDAPPPVPTGVALPDGGTYVISPKTIRKSLSAGTRYVLAVDGVPAGQKAMILAGGSDQTNITGIAGTQSSGAAPVMISLKVGSEYLLQNIGALHPLILVVGSADGTVSASTVVLGLAADAPPSAPKTFLTAAPWVQFPGMRYAEDNWRVGAGGPAQYGF